MKETLEKNTVVNLACLCGAVLGLFTIVCSAITGFCGGLNAILVSIISTVLWMARFAGCIFIMRWYMLKLSRGYEGVTNRKTFMLGMLSALFSAILVSAYAYFNIEFIHPEQMKEAMDTIYQTYSGILDSNTMDSLKEMEGSMSTISFVSSLIYCFLYGTALSAILSSNIPSKNPFEDEQK